MCNNRVLHFRKYKYNTFYTRPYGPIIKSLQMLLHKKNNENNEHARLIAILYKYTHYKSLQMLLHKKNNENNEHARLIAILYKYTHYMLVVA